MANDTPFGEVENTEDAPRAGVAGEEKGGREPTGRETAQAEACGSDETGKTAQAKPCGSGGTGETAQAKACGSDRSGKSAQAPDRSGFHCARGSDETGRTARAPDRSGFHCARGSGERGNRWRAEVAAGVAAMVCFVNVLPNDYCYDDNPIVRLNPKVNDAGQGLIIWTTDYWSQTKEASPNRDLLYRPVSLASYRLVRALCGAHPLPQHVLNVLLHALISVLVVHLCRHVGGSEATALAAGVLFAVLPIHTEVVAPVVGRADLLVTLGVLAAVLAHGRSLCAVDPSRRAWWRVVAAVAALVAMGSKEAGVTAVPLVLLFDAFRHWRLRAGDDTRTWWTWQTLWRLAYLAVPLGAYLALRYHALDGRLYQSPPLTKTINVLVDAPPWQHALGVLQLWGVYWAKTVWPAVLSIKYSINHLRLATSPLDPHVLIGAAVAFILILYSVAAWRRGSRHVALLSAAIGVAYLPTANAVMLIRVFFAERIWYLPSVWVVILVAVTVTRRVRRPVWGIVFAVICFSMIVRCWYRNAEWRDNGTLYAAAYRDQGNAVGPLQLYGQWLVEQGESARGIELLGRAVLVDPGCTDAHRSLAEAYRRAGNLKAALHHLQIANMQVPGHPATDAMLAQVSHRVAEQDEELKGLRRHTSENPADVDARIALVRRLRELGLVEEALTRIRERDAEFGGGSEWQAEYAVTLVYANDVDEAVERYRKSLRLDPGAPQRAVELAMLLLERRGRDDIDEAWRWAEHASTLTPEAPSVLACRAELSALRGDLRAALTLYDRAIRALPSDSDRRRVFEERARALGR